jgi:hypothetical protein
VYNSENNRFEPIDPALARKFDDPKAKLTTHQKVQRDWTRFSEGETVEVKGILFRVHEIGETRVILKPIHQHNLQTKIDAKENHK